MNRRFELDSLNQRALEGGGRDRLDERRRAGKGSARERIEALVDPGSFVEIDRLVTHRCADFGMEKKVYPGDGVITGSGRIEGRPVFVFSQDFTVLGGSLGAAHAGKICKVMELAMRTGAPLVGLNDSGGARIQEGVESLGGYADVFFRNAQASGSIPQISVILGPCAGGAVYSPALTDFIFMVEGTSTMFITGPEVIEAVTGESISQQDLGGSTRHAGQSGVAHFAYPDEASCLHAVRTLLGYLPLNHCEDPPRGASEDDPERDCPELETLLPEDARKSYDVRQVIDVVVDRGSFFEVHADFAPNLVVGFARFAGRAVGIVANQPAHLAGCLDIDSSVKGARFVRFCDAFNLPLVTLVDVPGFLPGVEQESGGIIRQGAKLLYAYCEASVAKITLVMRKAYGGAYDVMSSKHIGADLNFAFPNAEIAVMGPEAAVRIIHRQELRADPNALGTLTEAYRQHFASPFRAATLGYIDEIIEPVQTRKRLVQALELLANKRRPPMLKRHDNLPL